MVFRRHRQHLHVAVGEFDQPVAVVREPEVVLLTEVALIRQEFEEDFAVFAGGGHHRRCSSRTCQLARRQYSGAYDRPALSSDKFPIVVCRSSLPGSSSGSPPAASSSAPWPTGRVLTPWRSWRFSGSVRPHSPLDAVTRLGVAG